MIYNYRMKVNDIESQYIDSLVDDLATRYNDIICDCQEMSDISRVYFLEGGGALRVSINVQRQLVVVMFDNRERWVTTVTITSNWRAFCYEQPASA